MAGRNMLVWVPDYPDNAAVGPECNFCHRRDCTIIQFRGAKVHSIHVASACLECAGELASKITEILSQLAIEGEKK